MSELTCETSGHLWSEANNCIFCRTPRPAEITELTQIRASAVPAVPKEITATQRLAALGLAQRCEETCEHASNTGVLTSQNYITSALYDCAKLLRELAK